MILKQKFSKKSLIWIVFISLILNIVLIIQVKDSYYNKIALQKELTEIKNNQHQDLILKRKYEDLVEQQIEFKDLLASIHYILVPEEKEVIANPRDPSLSKEEFAELSTIANNFAKKYGYDDKLYNINIEVNDWNSIQYDIRRLFLMHSKYIIKKATQ